jgi:hypothetical protein
MVRSARQHGPSRDADSHVVHFTTDFAQPNSSDWWVRSHVREYFPAISKQHDAGLSTYLKSRQWLERTDAFCQAQLATANSTIELAVQHIRAQVNHWNDQQQFSGYVLPIAVASAFGAVFVAHLLLLS